MKILTIITIIMSILFSLLSANEVTAKEFPKVEIKTNQGVIVLELNSELAPITTENFLKYVESGFYVGTIFHRVIGNFMIQGGGYTQDFKEKPTILIKLSYSKKDKTSNKKKMSFFKFFCILSIKL